MFRRVIACCAATLLITALAGCFGGYPSQNKPTCSWTSQLPSNAGTLCSQVFSTLKTVVAAEVTGDNATIHRLVPNSRVAARIIVHGATLRSQHVLWLHVVPSFTLGRSVAGHLGAGFYIVGKTRSGKVSAVQTVYFRSDHGVMKVVQDQPSQEW